MVLAAWVPCFARAGQRKARRAGLQTGAARGHVWPIGARRPRRLLEHVCIPHPDSVLLSSNAPLTIDIVGTTMRRGYTRVAIDRTLTIRHAAPNETLDQSHRSTLAGESGNNATSRRRSPRVPQSIRST